MLHLASKVRGAVVHATDGDIGTVEDFYFEQAHWTIRYLLVDTGKWLSGRRVMISPLSVPTAWTMSEVPVSLTKDQVRNSPAIDTRQPPSRGSEAELLGYYGHPIYWRSPDPSETVVDPHAENLRSTQEIIGYHIKATDGDAGHVDDFLIGEESWAIRYLRVDTSNWLGGKSVIVAASVLEWIDSSRGHLRVGVTRDAVKHSPRFETIEPELSVREIGPPFVIL